mmetsp:Transcript_27498/g.50847  ORF Transcript_27498/g.50847 Transcript_27498/m.50847 type:complete len:293 (+) Transcript_27498:4469-5347(+)
MRPLIVAPADMHPDLVGGNIRKRMVQCLHMGVCNLDELGICQVGKKHMAAERQVRTVQLQVQTRAHNRFIFRLHRISQSRQISVAGRIKIILQEKRNHTGGRRIHKPPRGPMFGHGRLEVGNILLKLTLPFAAHCTCAHGARVFGRSAIIGEALEKAGELFQISGRIAGAVTGKPGVAILDIRRIADLGGLPIADNVDTCGDLFGNGVRHGTGHGGIKRGLVIGLFTFAGKDEIDDLLGPGQTAHMGCEDCQRALLVFTRHKDAVFVCFGVFSQKTGQPQAVLLKAGGVFGG